MGVISPHSVAFGAAVGTLIALLPTFGFSALLGFLVMCVFKTLNRPAVFLALIVFNPIVQIPIYVLSFKLGGILFADAAVVTYNFEILNQLYSYTRRFLVAHTMLTILISTLTYLATYLFFRKRFTGR